MARKFERSDATHCIHAGEERHGTNAGLAADITPASVFVLPSVEELRRYAEGKSSAYLYTRYANPTTRAAEEKIAALEGGEDCVVTASGMAAELALILSLCRAGDEIVSMLDVYGGTLHLLEDALSRFGIRTRFVPFHEMERVERHFSRQTKLLWLESPTNPTLRCMDLARLSDLAHKRRIAVCVDNTFATPILQKPLALGADFVVHSATKYLGGHSDVTAGAVVGPKKPLEEVRRMMRLTGGNLDPLASYLLIRGLKTLEIRVRRACYNAAQIAEYLARHKKVERVLYPGFSGNEGYQAACRQMLDYGMMVSFDIRGGGRAAERFIDALELWYLATSLGGVESTVSYPILSSHVGISKDRLKLLDVSPATVRLSVGIEDVADLVADLGQGLDRA